MKNIKKIIKEEISKYLSEVAGTPKVIEGYVNQLSEEFAPLLKRYFDHMEENDMDYLEIDEEEVFENPDENFPINKINLPIKIKLFPGSGDIKIEGAIYKDLTNPTLELSVQANSDVTEEMIDEKLDDILTHEITHMYELYKRGGSFGKKGTMLNKITDSELGKKYPKIWKYFLGLIYQTIDFEINARVSQVAKMSQKLRKQGKSQDEIMSTIKTTEPWKSLENWENFSPSLVKGEIEDMVNQQGLKEKGYDADKIIDAYKKQISNTFNNKKASPEEKSFLDKTEKMTADQFLSHWDKEFKREAKDYRRKMLKAIGSV